VSDSSAAAWIPLGDAELESPERIGNKAARLAELRRAGFLVPDGWILPVDRIDAIELPEAARALVALLPRTPAWIIRSSSPWEDREGSSAAGLFASEACGPSAHELTCAMERVIESRASEHVRELLGVDAPLALLAQPLLELEAWFVVELRPGRDPNHDGWSRLEADTPPPDLLRALQPQKDGAALLVELGAADGRWYVLQCRPAPIQALPPRPRIAAAPEEIDAERWRWDREHSARPLCPLLAGYFERSLQEQSEAPSRLFHGCWHDRVGPHATAWNDDARAQLFDLRPLVGLLEQIEAAAAAERWNRASWIEFMDLWLRFQRAYFARPTGAARRWLRSQPADEGAVGETVAQRDAELDELAARLDRDENIDWEAFLRRHGHHADWPWDGRGRTWSEDPSPLRRELRLRAGRPAAPSRANALPGEASRVLALLEEDDELLARSYAQFRRAVRGACLCCELPEHRWEDSLELDPECWESLLDRFDRGAWEDAVHTGRELAQSWLGQALLRGARSGNSLVGTPVFAGHVRAPLCVLPSACAGGGPAWGEILVVPSIQPGDAVVFRRLAGLVVEAGDPLGHAAVLAREAHVPCVVGVDGACARLAAEPGATLDARSGQIEPWEREGDPGFR